MNKPRVYWPPQLSADPPPPRAPGPTSSRKALEAGATLGGLLGVLLLAAGAIAVVAWLWR